MKTITEIKKIGKGNRYYLFVDDENFGVFEAEILARYCLKTGQSFDEKFFDELLIENGDFACFNRALNLLSKTMKSEKMLKDFLKEKKYPHSCIQKAIEKLKDYGYINDESYAENFISFASNSKSKKKIKYDLLSKGIDSNIIERLLQENFNEEDEEVLCKKLAEKFLKNKEININTKQKFFNRLAGKGFGFQMIAKVWEEVSNDRN